MHKIGKVKLKNNLMLAPMHGVNVNAFRLQCKMHGAGLVHTSMIHPESLFQGKMTPDLISEEKPVGAQLIGRDPDLMTRAAVLLEEKADLININFGCPDSKELARKTGGFLSKHPEQISKFLSKVISSINCPLVAKIRIGWDNQSLNHLTTAKILEDLGVDAIAVHGRTVKQGYQGKANWQAIREVKEKVNIPVIASGDAWDYNSYKLMMEKSNADFAMFGRPAMGNPQIFNDILNKTKTEKTLEFAIKLFKEFLTLYEKHSIRQKFSEIKTHAIWFVKSVEGAGELKNKLVRTKDLNEIKKILKNF